MMGSRPEGLNESGAWLARSGGRLRKAVDLEYDTFRRVVQNAAARHEWNVPPEQLPPTIKISSDILHCQNQTGGWEEGRVIVR